MKTVYLSVPHMGDYEEQFVREAFASNWLSTVGPNLNAFEEEFSALVDRPCVALSSGTAAMHLGLRLLGVGAGDEVISPTLTFVGGVNPINYLGARAVFVDSERESWNMDPQRLADALSSRAAQNRLPRAVIVVHLYGQSADLDPIMELCSRYEIPILEDAAEALGALYKGRPVGTFGDIGVYSFNGNKIITTTGGGMLVAKNRDSVDKARYWSTQARDAGFSYQHTEVGYNYRLSNVLAGIGRGQLRVLADRVQRRREIAFSYQSAFSDLPGIELMPQASYGLHTNWLSCFLVDEQQLGATRNELVQSLALRGIEARPVWKPMHLQPLFKDAQCFGGEVAADLFNRGICLPSSSSLSSEDQAFVIDAVKAAAGRGRATTAPQPHQRLVSGGN